MVTLLDLFAVRLANSKSIPIPGWHDGGLKQWPEETGNAPTAPSPISGPDAKSSGNLLWSIYLHDSHIRHSAAPDNRPMVMPRYGWLGQHRYCCGFSGDQTSEWETLQVIPTPSHVLDRISPIFPPFFPIFCAFSPSRRGSFNEPQAGTQGQETVARAPV